jgi:hypothetical protein
MSCVVRPYIPNVGLAEVRDPASWDGWNLSSTERAILWAAVVLHDERGCVAPAAVAGRVNKGLYYVRGLVKNLDDRGLWPFPGPRFRAGPDGDLSPNLSGDPYLDDVEMPEPSEGEKQRIREEIIRIRCRKRAEALRRPPPIGWGVTYVPKVCPAMGGAGGSGRWVIRKSKLLH